MPFTYIYSCPVCTNYRSEEIRDVEYRNVPIPHKDHFMERIFDWSGKMCMGDITFEPHFSPAFGKVVTRPSQIRDEIRKAKYEKGEDIVNIGNEKVVPVKSKPIQIDEHRAYKEIKGALNADKSTRSRNKRTIT